MLREHVGENIIIPDDLQLPQSWSLTVEDYHLPPGKWLVIADVHAPFHEIIALMAALEYGQKEGITGIFINGDLQDCQSVTYWPTVVRKDFMGEVTVVIDLLDYIRKQFPDAMIVYKPGNHEYRLPRYYAQHAPDLIENPILAMEVLLGLEERKIEFLDYHQLVYAGELPIVHGHEVQLRSINVNPARSLFLKINSWGMCSHLHRSSEHSSKNIQGTYLTTWSTGCLCNLNPEYNPFGNQWGWGFGIVENEASGDFMVENKRILDNGKVR
jgi:hypothetical protein